MHLSSFAFWLMLVAALAFPTLAGPALAVQVGMSPTPPELPADQAETSSDDEVEDDKKSIEGEGEEEEGEEAEKDEEASDEEEAEEPAKDNEDENPSAAVESDSKLEKKDVRPTLACRQAHASAP